MSYYVADVGEVIIKPEFREDFGYFFEERYLAVTNPLLKQYILDIVLENVNENDLNEMYEYKFDNIDKYISRNFIPLIRWSHDNIKDEWQGKYNTSYDKATGRFTYGIYFNMHGAFWWGIHEFLFEVLPEFTEKVLFSDGWAEPLE